MPAMKTRRSDRITVELPLQVSGADTNGLAFVENSRTAVISRHGAKISLRHKMARDQELVVRCLPTGKESDARIVGELGGGPEGYSYGIEFLDPQINIWDIEFPPLTQSEQATARALLECMRCRNRELVYLDVMEAEVLETGQGLSRLCKRCTDINIWKVVPESPAGEPMAAPAPPLASPDRAPPEPTRTQNERKEVRVRVSMTSCIRHPYLGEEIVATENLSRGGFSFRSPKRYGIGSLIDVALPYTRGGANIFVAARIEHGDEQPGQNFVVYGVAYIPAHKGWPGR
jgi:hypothetical protein